MDGIPYIGQYSLNKCDCYVATGFNKWGMTSSMVSAMLLTDMIMGKENPIAKFNEAGHVLNNPANGDMK